MSRLVAVLLAVPLLWVAPPAHAAAPTCQGMTATLVGRPGTSVYGTDGPDVVVSNGSSAVGTGAGDDIVCMTGTTEDGYRAKVDSGPGADSVVGSTGNVLRVELGLGADTFLGGDERDDVDAGRRPVDEFDEYEDDATDSISTGSGDDIVLAGGDDTSDLGPGDDQLAWFGPRGVSFSGGAEGGTGSNSLQLAVYGDEGADPSSWVLDNRTATLSNEGEVRASWHLFNRFSVVTDDSVADLLLHGNQRPETFYTQYAGVSGPPVRIEAAGGEDTIEVGGSDTPGQLHLDIDGGQGRDLIRVRGYEFERASLVLDLARGTYSYEDGDDAGTFPVANVEDAEVQGIPQVILRGDAGRNRLTVHADQTDFPVFRECHVSITARGGDDRLVLLSEPVDESWKRCPAPLLKGQAGDDVLVGSLLPETLLGGGGSDVARGGLGNDLCVAESRVGCERGHP